MTNRRHHLPPLAAMRAFEAAARHASFSRAAEELCVTHGAISHQIKSLETSLGVPLFQRLTRRVQLTEAGEALFAKVHAAFDLLETGTAQVMARYTNQPLVVSCIATFSMRWLMPRLQQFTSSHLGLAIRLLASNSPELFPQEDIDVSIRVGPTDRAGNWPANVEAHAFLDEAFGPVCSPQLLQHVPLRHPDDLHAHVLLHTESRLSAWGDWLRINEVTSIDPTAGPRFETFYLLLHAATSSFGVAIGPDTMIAEDLASGRLVAPFGFVPSGISMYVLYPRAQAHDPRCLALRDWLMAMGQER
jgi:LysR family transcriptional regulator, glycine cleavage system transcriptional activator